MENDFPSGEWVGYWLEGGPSGRYRQDMALTFKDGVLSGAGDDSVGSFRIQGGYDTESKEVWWTKQYHGSHSVFYKGYREIKGIWGTWELTGWRGGFHIWPRAEGDLDAETTAVEQDAPIEKELVLTTPGPDSETRPGLRSRDECSP